MTAVKSCGSGRADPRCAQLEGALIMLCPRQQVMVIRGPLEMKQRCGAAVHRASMQVGVRRLHSGRQLLVRVQPT